MEDAKLGISAKKEENFSEWYSQLLEQAELADQRYGIRGFVVYMAWSQMSIEKMFRIMSDALEKKGHLPVCMPTLIPEKNFTIEGEHVKGFAPEVFWVTETGDGKKLEEKYALRPTSETAFYQMYSLWIQSYRDLPFKRYQRANVFRAEKTKGTRPFLRGREFHWIETHNVFATKEEALNQVHEDMETTKEVLYDQFAIPHLFFERPQWDKFPGAEKTFAADALMGSGRVLQLPSTHWLGEKFSKPFNVQYLNEKGEKKYAHITCYGPAISRIYGAMIALHSDNQGLRVPFELAPLQIAIVPIYKDATKEAVLKKANELKKKFSKYSVQVDEREGYSPGWKFNYWELKGVPIRIEIGPKDLEKNTAVVFRRDVNKKEAISLDALSEHVSSIAKEFTSNLLSQAEESFEANTVEASTKEEIKKGLDGDKIVKFAICSMDMDISKEALALEEEMGAQIRGCTVLEEKTSEKCVLTGKPGKHVVYMAKSY